MVSDGGGPPVCRELGGKFWECEVGVLVGWGVEASRHDEYSVE